MLVEGFDFDEGLAIFWPLSILGLLVLFVLSAVFGVPMGLGALLAERIRNTTASKAVTKE